MKKQYIGPDEIKLASPKDYICTDDKIIKCVEVIYTNDKRELFPEVVFNNIVDDKACDYTELRDRKCSPVIEAILRLFLENGLRISETGYCLSRVNTCMVLNEDRAITKLFNDHEEQDRTVFDLEDIFKKFKNPSGS